MLVNLRREQNASSVGRFRRSHRPHIVDPAGSGSRAAGSGLAQSLGYTKEKGNKVSFHSEEVGVSTGTARERFQPQLALTVINYWNASFSADPRALVELRL